MARLMVMPEVAANASDAVLAEWMVRERSHLEAGQVIATVETDKAIVDVEVDTAGVLVRTLVASGARVPVGAPIAVLADAGEVVDVDAFLLGLRTQRSGPHAEEPPSIDRSPQPPSGGRIFASPLARRLAAERGLDLARIVGSGPHGRVRKADLDAAESATPPRRSPPERRLPEPAEFDLVPHTSMRRAVGRRLQESKRTVPHFYLRGTARVDALVTLRSEMNRHAPVRVSVNDMVVRAVAVAHRLHPEMNVTWADDAVSVHHGVDVAIAVAGDRGLVTPVVRSVDDLSVSQIAVQTRSLLERADSGRFRQDELEGGSITVSNLGMYGVEEFSAIINPPQSAILAVGAIREEPVVCDGAVIPARVMRLVLSVDHRPLDGAVAGTWMQTLLDLLQNPVRLLR